MKKFITYLFIAVICQAFLGCDSDNPSNNIIEEDYLTINGVKKRLLVTGNEKSFYYTVGSGGYDFDDQTGHELTGYYDLNLKDLNHEFIENLSPDFEENVTFKFIVNIANLHESNGTFDFKTIAEPSSSLNQNQTYTYMAIDDNHRIYAPAGQNITIIKKATPPNEAYPTTIIKFSNIYYGENIVSGKVTLR